MINDIIKELRKEYKYAFSLSFSFLFLHASIILDADMEYFGSNINGNEEMKFAVILKYVYVYIDIR